MGVSASQGEMLVLSQKTIAVLVQSIMCQDQYRTKARSLMEETHSVSITINTASRLQTDMDTLILRIL
jgi:hypothetical protein